MKVKFLLAFLFVFSCAEASPPGYLYYKILTTQENQITVGNNNLFNYPVLVRLTNADLKHTSSGGYVTDINGYDIIFTSSDGNTVIPHQLEHYDPVTGTLICWVQIPVLSATVNTNFYLYFSNNSVSTDQSTTAVWDLNYKGVWHLNTTVNPPDWTATGSDLTSFGTTNQSPAVIYDGEDVNPGQYLYRAPDPNLQLDADLTLETWVRFSTFQANTLDNVLISCGTLGTTSAENYHYKLNYIGTGGNINKLQLTWEYGNNLAVTNISTVAASPGINAWHHICVVRDPSIAPTGGILFYFDGVQLGAPVLYTNPPDNGASSSFQIGIDEPTSIRDIDGDFDEVRVSASVRSPEWVQTTYVSTVIGSTFITYGATNCISSDISNAGPDQNVCTSTATLAGNALTVGSGFWTLVSGSGIITTPTSPTSGVTGLGVGANTFKWTVSNGPCTAYSDNVIITRDANPTTSNAGSNFNVCTTSSTFAGNTPATGTGLWTLVSGTGVPTTPTSPTSAVTGLSVGANVFQWTISNGTCPSSSSQVTITRDNNPDIADAGPDQTVCNNPATMAANTPVIGTGTWSLISGSGTITTFNSPTTTITGLGIGANVFQWSIANGTCPPSTDQVTITRNAPPTTANAGPDQTICTSSTTLSANTPVIGNGSWLLVSGTGTITSPTSPTTTVTGLSVGTNSFRWRIQNLPCTSSRDTVFIFVDPAPTVANAGPDQTICSSTTTFAANSPIIGSGSWSLISGSGTITTNNSPTSSVTGLGVGANVFQWSIANGTCPPSTDQLTIYRDANPTTSNAGVTQNLCSVTSSTFAANNPVVGTGLWTLISGSGIPTTPNSNNSPVTGLGVGANIFQWTISNGTCPSSSSQVTINVDPAPSTANAGPDQTVCSTASTFAGNTPGIGTGYWTLISGSGVPTTPNSPTSAVTGLGVGANIFQWTIVSGGCPSSSDQITITRDANPTVANAGPDQTICSSTSTFAGNIPATGVGLWTLISGSGVPTTPTSATSSVTGLSVGANVFQWTISNGTCPSSNDQITITVDPTPSTSNAGPDQTVCSSSSVFAANAPTTGTGTWSLISGSGVATNPNSPTSAVTGLGVGANVFQWTIVSGGCPPSIDQITITRDAVPTTSNAGLDQAICSSTSAFTGNTPSTGTGTWSLISGSATIASVNSPTSGISNLGIGNNVFQWVIANGTCPSSRDTVIIHVDANPSSSYAGIDQFVCSSNATFSANVPTIGTGMWSLVSGTGVPTNPTSPTSAVTGLSVGVNIFMFTVSNGTCPVSTDMVNINVDPLPSPSNAGPDQTICASTTNFAANTPTVGNGAWALISGGGSVTNFNSPTSAVTALPPGQNIFEWVINNGSCTPTRDTVVITVNAPPTPANAGPDQTICSSSSVFAGNTPSVGTGFWSIVSGTGTPTTPTSPTSAVTGLSVGLNYFEWKTMNGVCAVSRDTMVIKVDPLPTTANAGPDQNVCATTSIFAANTPTIGNGVWALVSGTGAATIFNSATSPVTGLSVGLNYFQWIISNGTCPSSRDTVLIKVDANPTVSNAGVDQVICADNTIFSGNTPTTGTGTWQLVSGAGTIINANSPTASVTGLNIGQNKFEWVIANGSCPSSRDTVIITRFPLPTASQAGPDQNICATNSVFAANTPTSGIGFWAYVSGGGTITTFNSPTSTVTNLSVGANVFEWVITNGPCNPSRDTIVINVSAPPTVSNAGPDQHICFPPSTTLAGNTPSTGTGTWTSLTSGTLVNPNSPTSAVNNISVGANVFVWTIINGVCPASTDTVIIYHDPSPTVPNAGPDQNLCTNSTNFSGNFPAIGLGTWSLVSGSGNIVSFNNPNSPVNTLGTGPNVFVWTIANGTCPPLTDTVVITVYLPPTTAAAGPDQNVCIGTATMSANAPSIGTGTWTALNSGTITNINSPTTAINAMNVGANKFVWTITNGTCPPSRDTVIITRDPLPSNADAGADITVCVNSVNMNATAPTIGTGTWSVLVGTGNVQSFNSPTTLISNLSFGTNTFVWTVSSGTCIANTDTVNVFWVGSITPANAGSDQTVCGTNTTMTALQPTVGVGTWSVVVGAGTFTSPNLFNSPVTGMGGGQNIYRWTVVNNTCPTTFDDVTVFVYLEPSSSDAGPDKVVVHDYTDLEANTPTNGTAVWSVISGSGTFVDPNDPHTHVTGLSMGANVFRWTISNGSCQDSIDQVTITLKDLTVPNGFSPDGDGVNDYFEIVGLLEYPNSVFEVFNRWGNVVYRNSDYKNDWNGKNQSGGELTEDTYYYILHLTDDLVYKGFVVLKRK